MYFLTASCVGSDYDYRISLMSCEELTYNQLPRGVQESLSMYPLDSLFEKGGMLLINKNDSNRYKCESVLTGPWTDYHKIIDTQKNITYRIERLIPHPYIIYKEKLYIADKYNYLSMYLRETIFSEYKLK